MVAMIFCSFAVIWRQRMREDYLRLPVAAE